LMRFRKLPPVYLLEAGIRRPYLDGLRAILARRVSLRVGLCVQENPCL
jgi:hypothetical protein